MGEREQTVFVVYDDPATHAQLRAIAATLNLRYAAFSSARAFLGAYEPLAPGCLLLDLDLRGMNGMELQNELNVRGAIIPVIFMSAHADVSTAVAAMRQGAFDFLLKPLNAFDLSRRIGAALRRDRDNRQTLSEFDLVRTRVSSLTPREREVLEYVARGLSNKAMAEEMALSQRTVELHRSNVMLKMCAKSIAHLVRMCMDLERIGTTVN